MGDFKADSNNYYSQEYKVSSSVEMSNYTITAINNFPDGSYIADTNNNVKNTFASGEHFKVLVPKDKILDNFAGTISATGNVKTYPVFYGKSPNDAWQDYALTFDSFTTANGEATLNVNAYKSSIKVIKIDKDTKKAIEGVEFNFKYSDGQNIGDYKTNKNGEISLNNLKQGKVIATETKTNSQYILDSKEKEILLDYDAYKELTIENEKMKGQIEIVKTAETDNKITGAKAGNPIANVPFDIYDEDKNYIETITTNEQGIAKTSLLEKGVKYIKEKGKIKYYLLNTDEYKAEIKEDGEVVKVNITNKPETPDVDIEKTGIIQTTANEEIRYDFKIKNTGNVPLDNFTWYDYLPTDYVRMTKLVTGTYNQDLNYSVYYKTNLNDYKLLKENLNTKTNNYIDFTNLELEDGEFVTEFKADFGTVDVGFESVISPYVFVTVNSTVKNDDTFTNKTRIEGINDGYLVWDEDDHTTKIYEKKINIKLPRTGC